MAFNTYNNNTAAPKVPELTVNSNYRMNNAESRIDATCITFRYWRTNLCIGIFPRKNTGNDEVLFDMDNGITIYLSHTKARILKHEIELYLKDPVTYNSVGVPSGSSGSAITISNGSEYGKNTPVVTIRKTGENGEVIASFAYEFKQHYHYSIRNYDGRNFDAVYDDYDNLEIEQFVTVLDEYIKASTNAIAFTVMEQRRYPAYRMENKIDAIAASLGVETKNNQRRFSNTSHFDNHARNSNSNESSSNVSYGSATLEDLE